MHRLTSITDRIQAPDQSVGDRAQARLDNLTKPRGSLGRLEDIARWLAVVRGSENLSQPNPAVAVFAADHGVCASGVSLFPQEVTVQMIANFCAGGAGINVLAGQVGAKVRVVDVGVAADLDDMPGLIKAKVAYGTANMAEQPAMTMDQTLDAIAAGAKVAADFIEDGHDLLLPGDMGIGNTTACAAITSVLCGLPPEKVTGRGTGLDDSGLDHKTRVIQGAIELHKVPPSQPLEVLAKLGGLEIAAICGYMLEAAARRVPVILDGFIATSGALVASRLCPDAKQYFLAGHLSVESGHGQQLANMGMTPLLNMNMRLGEGTGAALATSLVRGAVAIYNQMATFDSAGVCGEETQPA